MTEHEHEHEHAADEVTADDATRVVPRGSATFDGDEADDTRAVTRANARPAPSRVPIIEPDGHKGATGSSSSRNPAPPVPDPEPTVRGLPANMFKSPLDPRRKARPAPFPTDAESLPRRGVQQGLPVVYGARPPESGQAAGRSAVDDRVGPVPASRVLPCADRTMIPSIARQNRRFSQLAIAGGAGVLVVVVAGLWGIAHIAFG